MPNLTTLAELGSRGATIRITIFESLNFQGFKEAC